jgi:hypothetical protein
MVDSEARGSTVKHLVVSSLVTALALLVACGGPQDVAKDAPPPDTAGHSFTKPPPGPTEVAGSQAPPCRSPKDCQPQARCRTVDYVTSQLCGACSDLYPDECKTDSDCPAGSRCQQTGPCGCGARQYKCTPGGCSADTECKAGWACDSDGHCGPVVCKTDKDCPAHFACGASSCSRRACTSDSGCKGGFCVNRKCYAELGTCYLPRPGPPSAAPSFPRPISP